MEYLPQLDSLPLDLPWLLAAALGLLFLLALIGWGRARRRLARANRGRQRLARWAERAAERLVQRAGYKILERQALRRWHLRIDGRLRQVSSRVDLLVERRGRRFVADVKTGDLAPDPTKPATRRQLLEYLLLFGADGALLIDMEKRRIREVEFPDLLDSA
jgi:hypothetical protein